MNQHKDLTDANPESGDSATPGGQGKVIEAADTPVRAPKKLIKLKRPRHTRRWLLMILGLLIIVLVVWVTIAYKKPANTAYNACTDKTGAPILLEAGKLLDRTKTQELKVQVEKIQKLANFEKDPNCMYAVVIYYTNSGDAKNARNSLTQLEKVYKPNQMLSSQLNYANTIKPLKEGVVLLENTIKQIEKNSTTFSNP